MSWQRLQLLSTQLLVTCYSSHSLTKLGSCCVNTLRILWAQLLESAMTITVRSRHTRFTSGIVSKPFVVTLCVTNEVVYERLHNHLFPHYDSSYTPGVGQFHQWLQCICETVVLILNFVSWFSTSALPMSQVWEIRNWPPATWIVTYWQIEKCCRECNWSRWQRTMKVSMWLVCKYNHSEWHVLPILSTEPFLCSRPCITRVNFSIQLIVPALSINVACKHVVALREIFCIHQLGIM